MKEVNHSDMSYHGVNQTPQLSSSESAAPCHNVPQEEENQINNIAESSLKHSTAESSSSSNLDKKRGEITSISEHKRNDSELIEKISDQADILIREIQKQLENDLYEAISRNDVDAIKVLLPKMKISSLKLNNFVMFAAKNNRPDAIRALLSDGRLLHENYIRNILERVSKITPFHADVVRALLSDGRKISSHKFRIILRDAAENGRVNVIQALFSDGREIDEDSLHSALRSAAEKDQVEVIRFLLSEGREIDRDFFGSSGGPVVYAAQNGCVAAIRFLLSDGREIDQEDLGGAVYFAAVHGHPNSIRELLSNGRRINQSILDSAWSDNLTLGLTPALRIAILFELINNGRVLGQDARNSAVLFAANQGHLELLEILLRQGPINQSVRDSARTQASGENRELIHSMLSAAQVVSDDPSRNNSMAVNRTHITLAELEVHPEKYLKTICEKGIPTSIFLTDHPNAVDLGGVKKQVISTLSKALSQRLHLIGEKLPFWEKEDEAELMAHMGKFFSLLHTENINRTDKLLTGEIVNPLFFDLVKLVAKKDIPEEQMLKEVARLLGPHIPDYSFCFDYILDPTPENEKKYAKINEEVYLGGLDRDPLKGSFDIINSFLRPAQGFTKGMTGIFKETLFSQDSKTLSLSIQGQTVSSELLLNALIIKDNGEVFLQKVDWLKEKIHSSDKEWQLHFLKAITGKTSMSVGIKINIKKSWREGYVFECHTCFNSIDFPNVEMEKEAFLSSLDHAIVIDGYNIA